MVEQSECRRYAGGTVVVEPHRDDSAMFFHVARRGFPMPNHLITVFSEYEPPDTEIRRAEGLLYCERFDYEPHQLGFLDYPLRDKRDPGGERELKHKIREKLTEVCEDLQCSWVIVPRPYGNRVHPDHQIVWLAALGAFAGLKSPILVIADDLPYSRRPLAATFGLAGKRYVPRLFPFSGDDLLEKRNAMKTYESQMRPEYFESIEAPAPGDHMSRYSETLWVPSNVVVPARKGSTCSMRMSDNHRADRVHVFNPGESTLLPRANPVSQGRRLRIEDLGK